MAWKLATLQIERIESVQVNNEGCPIITQYFVAM